MIDHKPTDRPTIGFLTANIHIGASRVLWPGILEAAVAGNVNLICFPGGRLHAAEAPEMMRNLIYQQVDQQQLDGLVIWTSALVGATRPQEVADFRQLYHPLPIVDLASSSKYGPRVTIDGNQGMRALLIHLIEDHGYQRIALIRGPENHPYALERYRAFVETVREKGLSPDERLISPAVSWSRGAEAMSVLLDERGLQPGQDFQAVVATSDLLAIGAIRLMAERGIHVPIDVAVAGFNDIEEGRLVRPPLTSVSLPFYEQGRQSVETLLAILARKDAPDAVMLSSRLLVRQSCGCPSWSEKLATAELTTLTPAEAHHILKQTQDRLETEISRVIRNKGIAATWAKQLLDAFRSEIDGIGNGRFRTTLDGMLQQGTLDGDETSAWQNTISILRCELLPMLKDKQRIQAEALFGQARVVIGDAVQRAHIARQLHAERQSSTLRDIGQALITTFDVDRLAAVLAEQLPELGIRSAYLALYDNPADPLSTSRLILAYSDNGRIPLGGNDRRYPSRQLIPPDLLPKRRYTLLVEPLFFQQEPLGIVVFEVGPRDGDIYEVLRGHISSALKGALLFQESARLFQEAHEARVAAEQADQIKTRLLANVSHELRTPLNIIISHAQRLSAVSPEFLHNDLTQIEQSAEHQLRLINDLLDLSRAEINALDLYPMMLDPYSLISDAFSSMAKDAVSGVTWRLQLPQHLPIVKVDPVRLRQILLNLLSNAARFTPAGEIALGAEAVDARLHIWVADTGVGIPAEVVDHIYEPFVTYETAVQPATGIGLGLSITRHLVALHNGVLAVESTPGAGSTFHVYLPLPDGESSLAAAPLPGGAVVWLVSRSDSPSQEIVQFSLRQQLTLQHLHPQASWEALLAVSLPAAVIWDMAATDSEDWQLMRRLHNHPQLHQIPFVLYQHETATETAGLTSLVVKPASTQALWAAIRPTVPEAKTGSVLIVDDDARARRLTQEAVRKGLPDYTLRTAVNGAEGLAAMLDEPPDLVILDLMMPEMDGFEVLERMRLDERTRLVPVVILSGRQLSLADIRRLERYTAVTLRSKDVFTQDEIATSVHQALFGDDALPPQTSALAKQAVAYLHQNYTRPLTRQEIADDLGMSEDYFSRTFNKELGISPWDYLNRYRVAQAKSLLQTTSDSVQKIAHRVGFTDPAYFSRVFRKIVGQSPSAYRQINS
ncbi:MAG: substrate-binding domain-containing protein [Chloroflexota bacterium]